MNLLGIGLVLAIIGAVLWGIGFLPGLGYALLAVGVILLLVALVLHIAGRGRAL